MLAELLSCQSLAELLSCQNLAELLVHQKLIELLLLQNLVELLCQSLIGLLSQMLESFDSFQTLVESPEYQNQYESVD